MAHAVEPEYTTTGLNHRKLLMWVFLGSDCLFFGALIATYMVYRGQSLTGPYPIDIINVPVTTISTFVLLMSSFAMVQALAATHADNKRGIVGWLVATAVLGAIFIGFQVVEFNTFKNEGLTLGGNLFGATFFTLTGFHGAHVTLGIIWLVAMAIVANKGRVGPNSALDIELLGLYWHFVDIVWIVIFTLLYLIAGFDAGPAAMPGG
ncbi:MAG: cytochrome oxidase subunit III [SAR202 cluster bacterium]|uniref:Cytochrome c oxidase polypeptide III n=1 Tax=hydrothermal vent metagenome TaxID=652676 RepID=A0A170QA98_9ZZZZ|nr:cytochrome c oxidase subunit 3 [Dehalococcoidia bacterium]MQG41689.1 cytochrome oxidase subunit III [SAR202 cluster bacterium]MQG45697.1 cytochrome oxidase subunit III [SAR202 cluster bacterium]MQG63378.1 cytochrome oxidase subunit III [SAR202 cluster bacterium]